LNLKRGIWILIGLLIQVLLTFSITPSVHAWFEETHIAVTKVAGYSKWFNACGPDMIEVKMDDEKGNNHYVNNPRGTDVTPKMVMAQVDKYDQIDEHGHLYGAIIASFRNHIRDRNKGQVWGIPPGLLRP
jgi:hypothetical protein